MRRGPAAPTVAWAPATAVRPTPTWAYTGAKATIAPAGGNAGAPDADVVDAGGADGGAPAMPSAPVTITIAVRSVKDLVALSDLLLEAAPKPTVAGGSNIALLAVDATRVTIQRMFILAGPGADGGSERE